MAWTIYDGFSRLPTAARTIGMDSISVKSIAGEVKPKFENEHFIMGHEGTSSLDGK